VWFLADGNIKRSGPGTFFAEASSSIAGAPEDAQGEDEPPPLSEAEFEAAKAAVREENARPSVDADGNPMYYGQPQFIQNHSMSEYLEKIRGLRNSLTNTTQSN
jgi:hypothetical protein